MTYTVLARSKCRRWVKSVFIDRPVIAKILRHWSIRSFRIVANLGSAQDLWMIRSEDTIFVLKRARGPSSYLEYQLAVMKQLRTSSFPYAVPTVLPTKSGADYVQDGSCCWASYSFVEGVPIPSLSDVEQSESLGVLVGHFHNVAGGVGRELGIAEYPELFDHDEVTSVLLEAGQWMSSARIHPELGGLIARHAPRIRQILRDIPAELMEQAVSLPKYTIYDDWHRLNVIALDGRIAGLVDFDSLVEAPRIVDFQNALTYVLLDCTIPHLDLIRGFAAGYGRVARLSGHEVSLVYFVMLDRIAWHVADLLKSIRAGGRGDRDRLAISFIQCFCWLSENHDLFLRGLSEGQRLMQDATD
jgi:Ser/Thr protein kinase RdoA (MazF antagonist)